MDSFAGKVVLITGGSAGIGAALASVLRPRGARLVVNARDAAKLSALEDTGTAVVAGDITDGATRQALIDTALARFGRIDIVINNAGRGSYYPPSEAPLDDARALFELNFFAPLHLAQLATPHLKQSRGILVNVSSIAGQMSLPWLSIYSASKFALASLSSSQRIELRRHGVHVMTVFPGYVDTAFQEHATGAAPPPGIVKGKRFAVSVENCAAAIVRGIERRSHTVVTPAFGWSIVWLNRLFPRFVESRMEQV